MPKSKLFDLSKPTAFLAIGLMLIILVMVAAPGGLHQLWKAAAARLSHARKGDAS